MRLTRHDYDVLQALTKTNEIHYSHIPKLSREKLGDLRYIDHAEGYYHITAKGKEALLAVRGAPVGTPFRKGDRFDVANDTATLAWLKELNDAGRINLKAVRAGKWRITVCD